MEALLILDGKLTIRFNEYIKIHGIKVIHTLSKIQLQKI